MPRSGSASPLEIRTQTHSLCDTRPDVDPETQRDKSQCRHRQSNGRNGWSIVGRAFRRIVRPRHVSLLAVPEQVRMLREKKKNIGGGSHYVFLHSTYEKKKKKERSNHSVGLPEQGGEICVCKRDGEGGVRAVRWDVLRILYYLRGIPNITANETQGVKKR